MYTKRSSQIYTRAQRDRTKFVLLAEMLRQDRHDHHGEKLDNIPREDVRMLLVVHPAGEEVVEMYGEGEVETLLVPPDEIDDGERTATQHNTEIVDRSFAMRLITSSMH